MATDWVEFGAEFGNRLRYYRRGRGFTQEVLADRVGLSRSYIARLESGKRVNPTLEVILKLLCILEVPLSEFFAPFTEVVNPFPA